MRRGAFVLLLLVLTARPAWAIDCTQVDGTTNVENAVAAASAGGTITCDVGSFVWTNSFNTAAKANLTITGTKTTVQASPAPTTTTMRLTACNGGLAAGHRLLFIVPHTVPGGSTGVDTGTIQSINGSCDVVLTAPLTGIPLTGSDGSVTGLTRIAYGTLVGGTTPVQPNSNGVKLTGFAFAKGTVAVRVVNLLSNFSGFEFYENDVYNPQAAIDSGVLCSELGNGRCSGVILRHNVFRNLISLGGRAAGVNNAMVTTLWGEDAPWGLSTQPVVEDNTIYDTATAGIDCDFSGRLMSRFNRVVRSNHETHGTRNNPPGFGCRAADYYKNIFIKDTSRKDSALYQLRGGSHFVWGNHLDSAYDFDFGFDIDRNTSCGVPVSSKLPIYDGNAGNAYPSQVYPGYGWHCLGTPGLGKTTSPYNTSTDEWPGFELEPVNFGLNIKCASPPCSPSATPATELLVTAGGRLFSDCVEYQLSVSYATFLASNGACGSTSGTKVQMEAVNGGDPPVSTAWVYFYVTDEHDWNDCVVGNDGQWYRGKSDTAWTLVNQPLQYPHPNATNRGCVAAAEDEENPVTTALSS